MNTPPLASGPEGPSSLRPLLDTVLEALGEGRGRAGAHSRRAARGRSRIGCAMRWGTYSRTRAIRTPYDTWCAPWRKARRTRRTRSARPTSTARLSRWPQRQTWLSAF